MKMLLAFFLTVFFSMTSFAIQPGPSARVQSQTEASVTSTSAQVLAANPYRTYLLIVNKGTVTGYIKFNSASSSTEGIPIPANGVYEPLVAPTNAIFLKSSSTTGTMTVISGG
jgi:hypothetical protein